MTAAQGCLHARHALVRHALEEADVEAQLIPLDGRACAKHTNRSVVRGVSRCVVGAFVVVGGALTLDLNKREADGGLPLLWRFEDPARANDEMVSASKIGRVSGRAFEACGLQVVERFANFCVLAVVCERKQAVSAARGEEHEGREGRVRGGDSQASGKW